MVPEGEGGLQRKTSSIPPVSTPTATRPQRRRFDTPAFAAAHLAPRLISVKLNGFPASDRPGYRATAPARAPASRPWGARRPLDQVTSHRKTQPPMARKLQVNRVSKRRTKTKVRGKKKDPLFVDGQRPRPMYVDYKNVELLKKLVNRQGKIISRRKSGCTAVSQHAVTRAIKRARYMALLPYVGE